MPDHRGRGEARGAAVRVGEVLVNRGEQYEAKEDILNCVVVAYHTSITAFTAVVIFLLSFLSFSTDVQICRRILIVDVSGLCSVVTKPKSEW